MGKEWIPGKELFKTVLCAKGPFFYEICEVMKMKKILVLALALALALAGCGSDLPSSGGITDFGQYTKELTDEELKEAMKGANNDIENRPDENICYITITCNTALESGELSEAMLEILPENGVILENYEAKYEDGESVFDVIARAVRENKIHMEYSGTKSVPYIEGVANLYEFDCGSLSGWMYRVNGWFPSFGMGQYKVERGDSIELIYTCDLGKDVGDNYMK